MSKDEVQFIGLDFEASGSSTIECAPIQLGLAVGTSGLPGDPIKSTRVESWSKHFKWSQFADDYRWEEEAFQVHKIERARLNQVGVPAHVVDAMAVAWLWERLKVPRMNRLAVGWNVAGYDMQFVERHLPYLRRTLSYRTIDLNALCFGLHVTGGHPSWKDWKRQAKQYANGFIEESTRHDAETDAVAALYELEFLRTRARIRDT